MRQTSADCASGLGQHPLQHRWVLWYDNPKKRHSTESWEENLKLVYAFNTVEDFWWCALMAFAQDLTGANANAIADATACTITF